MWGQIKTTNTNTKAQHTQRSEAPTRAHPINRLYTNVPDAGSVEEETHCTGANTLLVAVGLEHLAERSGGLHLEEDLGTARVLDLQTHKTKHTRSHEDTNVSNKARACVRACTSCFHHKCALWWSDHNQSFGLATHIAQNYFLRYKSSQSSTRTLMFK